MTTRQAAFRRIADEIAGAIRSGELKPGARLPSTARLAQQHGVSTATIDRAMSLLHDRGLLDGAPGKGRYVANPQ